MKNLSYITKRYKSVYFDIKFNIRFFHSYTDKETITLKI